MDLEIFAQNYLVRGLTRDEQSAIADLGKLQRFTAQEFLIKAGAQSADVFVILDGRVNVYTSDGDKLAEIGPGSVIGEVSLIDARPRSADAVCVGLVDAVVFDARALRTYLNANRNVGFTVLINLGQVLCSRLRSANEKIDMLSDHANDAWKHAL